MNHNMYNQQSNKTQEIWLLWILTTSDIYQPENTMKDQFYHQNTQTSE